MNTEPASPEQSAASGTTPRQPCTDAHGRFVNADTALLSGCDLDTKHRSGTGSKDMRSQVQALQRAIALFRLKP
jgi:hypothetical protein